MKNKVLLIDENIKFGKNLNDYFMENDLILLHRFNFNSGFSIVKETMPNLIIIDVLSVEVDLLESYQLLRQKTSAPIIILTARDKPIDQIINQLIEPDKYLHKPFQPTELLEIVQTLLIGSCVNSSQSKINKGSTITFKNFEINEEHHKVKILNKNVELSNAEFQLLYFLASNPLKTFTGEEILNTVKDRKFKLLSLSFDIAINNLKQKLMPLDYIKTVMGSGYSFVPNYESH